MKKGGESGRAGALRMAEFLPQDAEGGTQDACAPRFAATVLVLGPTAAGSGANQFTNGEMP
jgi:hypothetical protein